jgi:hypothetical protein
MALQQLIYWLSVVVEQVEQELVAVEVLDNLLAQQVYL